LSYIQSNIGLGCLSSLFLEQQLKYENYMFIEIYVFRIYESVALIKIKRFLKGGFVDNGNGKAKN